MKTDQLKNQIVEGSAEISRLHRRVHETSLLRGPEWVVACTDFRERYDTLAFPGGYQTARERIASGDAQTMEAAICFLELRPFFFGSGYMFEELLRSCKRAPLSATHSDRLDAIFARLFEWRRRKVPSNIPVCSLGHLRIRAGEGGG